MAVSGYLPTNNTTGFPFSTSSPALVVYGFFDDGHFSLYSLDLVVWALGILVPYNGWWLRAYTTSPKTLPLPCNILSPTDTDLQSSKVHSTVLSDQLLQDHCKKGGGLAQSCRTICDPVEGSLPGSTVHGIFQARILEWAAISFSPTQGLNPGLLHCRQMLYHLSHQGSTYEFRSSCSLPHIISCAMSSFSRSSVCGTPW